MKLGTWIEFKDYAAKAPHITRLVPSGGFHYNLWGPVLPSVDDWAVVLVVEGSTSHIDDFDALVWVLVGK